MSKRPGDCFQKTCSASVIQENFFDSLKYNIFFLKIADLIFGVFFSFFDENLKIGI